MNNTLARLLRRGTKGGQQGEGTPDTSGETSAPEPGDPPAVTAKAAAAVASGPRTRFGTIHVLNSYFDHIANYGVAATDGARVRIEGSVFYNVAPPVQPNANFGPVTTILDPPATAGYVDLVGSVINSADGNGQNVIPATQVVPWMPPYPYTADSAGSAAVVVTQCVGPGHITVPPAN